MFPPLLTANRFSAKLERGTNVGRYRSHGVGSAAAKLKQSATGMVRIVE